MYPIPANATRIRYLESTGTQYIDTGVVPNGATGIDCDFAMLNVKQNFSPVFWSRGSSATDRAFCFEGEYAGDAKGQARWDYGNYGAKQVRNVIEQGARTTASVRSGTLTVDTTTLARNEQTFTGAGSIILFNFCNYVNGERQMLSVACQPIRIYGFTIYDGSTLVRSFVPVRVGSTGCLFDRVTGQFFYNQGTGNFVCGEDDFSIFSHAVKHLSSTGTILASRAMGDSSGTMKAVRKHYDMPVQYTIDECNGNAPTAVNVYFPSGTYDALDYTPTWEHHRFAGWYTTKVKALPLLPSGVSLVEYVKNERLQRVVTGIQADANLVIRSEFDIVKSDGTWVIGSYPWSDGSDLRIFKHASNATLYHDRGNSRINGETSLFTGGSELHFNVEAGNFYVKDIPSGTNKLSGTAWSGSFASNVKMVLFSEHAAGTTVNGTTNPTEARIYWCQFLLGGSLVRDFYPVVDSSNVAGFYDAVSGTVYYSSTSTALIAGETVDMGVEVSPSDSVVFDRSTVYARWQLPTTVTFDATTNGGQMPSGWVSPDYYKGQPYGTLPEPTKSGEVFLGWFTSGGARITESSTVTTGTLTARYAAVTWGTTYSCTTTSSYKNTGIYSASRYSTSDPIVVDWGDGTTDVVYGNISQLAHTYPSATTYTVKISDNISTFCPSYNNSTWYQTTSQNQYTFKKVLTLSSKVTQLSSYAFYYCSAMTDAIIPSGATSIPTYCFYYCSQLKSSSVQLPSTVTSIGSCAFYYCNSSNFNSITIPAACTSIGSYGFYYCYYLHPVFESGSVALTLNIYSFTYCGYNGSAFTIDLSPRKITSIPNYCFQNCRYLKGITWPQGLTSIGGYAFRYCFNYAASTGTVEIPEGVTSISGTYAFGNCLYLTAVTLPSTLTSLNNYTFYSCTRLATITSNRSTAPTVSAATFGNSTNYYTGRTSYSTGTNKLYVPAGATGYNASYWASVLLYSTKCGFTLEEMSAGKTLPVTIVGSGYGGSTSYSMTIDDVGGTLTITNISGGYSFADASNWRIMDFRATSTTESFVIMETATNSNIVVGLKTYGCSEDFVGHTGSIVDSADFET